ncbi:MAG: hypothetical protein H7Y86_07520 [Rhizobacter sp.]|nr:hypothetical protein [Ferruginibacter sp.]
MHRSMGIGNVHDFCLNLCYAVCDGASSAVNNRAYVYPRRTLYHYVRHINESENKSGTSAYILLPGILDTGFNREAMPDADFTEWTKPGAIALRIKEIVEAAQTEPIIEL